LRLDHASVRAVLELDVLPETRRVVVAHLYSHTRTHTGDTPVQIRQRRDRNEGLEGTKEH